MVHYEKIYETDDYLVINKPAGLLAHPAEPSQEETLADQLLKDYRELYKIGDDPNRPGLMHRLDRLASGLMVIAKTQASFTDLKEQFQKRTINKIYTILGYGRIARDEGEINFPIIRSAKGYRMAAKPRTFKGEDQAVGRQAVTEFKIVRRYRNYTLLKVKIKTGRTHQIRVHFFAYGNPVVGDDLYYTRKTKVRNMKLSVWLNLVELNQNRLFLVADELEFTDLHGQRQKFNLPLPVGLQELLKNIK
jgi:23S rRNA pseudouridine1911/1915/1917 synthase